MVPPIVAKVVAQHGPVRWIATTATSPKAALAGQALAALRESPLVRSMLVRSMLGPLPALDLISGVANCRLRC
jgi:hypothetical protein